jgi:hypothetical protein
MSTPLDRLRARLARKSAARRQRHDDTVGAEPPIAAPAAEPPPPSPAEPPVPAEPRLVRRIVWAYEVGVLPVPWLMGYKRLRAMVERAGFAVRVDLTPLSGLPADTDVLCVPDDLAAAGRAAAPDAHIIAFEGRPPQEALRAVVDQLGAGVALTAERAATEPASELDAPAEPALPAEPAAEWGAPGRPPAEPGAPAEPAADPAPPRMPFTPARGKIVRYRGWERLD